MSLEQNVWSIIQSASGGRVYPIRLPEEVAYPAVTFRIFEGKPIQSQTSTMRNPLYRFSVWATTYDACLAGAQELVTLLNRHTGLFSAVWEDEHDRTDPQTGMFHRVLDFRVWSN